MMNKACRSLTWSNFVPSRGRKKDVKNPNVLNICVMLDFFCCFLVDGWAYLKDIIGFFVRPRLKLTTAKVVGFYAEAVAEVGINCLFKL